MVIKNYVPSSFVAMWQKQVLKSLQSCSARGSISEAERLKIQEKIERLSSLRGAAEAINRNWEALPEESKLRILGAFEGEVAILNASLRYPEHRASFEDFYRNFLPNHGKKKESA